MQMDTIGRNIRKYRQQAKMRQEDLAAQTNLSVNYIGMIERGEKIPAMDSFIAIVNTLGVSADMILCDVIQTGYRIKSSLLTERIGKLPKEEQERFYAVAEAFFK